MVRAKRRGLLPPQAPGLAPGLDRGLLDGGDVVLKLVPVAGADRDEAGRAQHAVPGGELGLLGQDVVVLGDLGGVLDLAHAGALGRLGDVAGLLAAQVPGRDVRADGLVPDGERALHTRR